MAYSIFQIDHTTYGTQTRLFNSYDYKDQAENNFLKLLRNASKALNANETQPTMNYKNVWHMYVNGIQKRSYVLVKSTKKCDGKAEAKMRAEYTWVD